MTNDNNRSVPAVRVLIVEDFEPFRRFIRSAMDKHSNVQIVGEASDGLDAVRKAEAMQPDLILLDIGLPTLNGMEAARQIRTLSPQSRIVFLTQESDPDVVQEALNLGAKGYVLKTRAAIDLAAAVDEALEGRQVVSSRLSAQEFTTQAAIHQSELSSRRPRARFP
jgi:DNA-binding NarL/FixJ family response regulator